MRNQTGSRFTDPGGVAKAWLALPAVLFVSLFAMLFRVKLAVDLTSSQVEQYLENLLYEGDSSAWDDFTSSQIKDPRLDQIRESAKEVNLPLDPTGRAKLRTLLEQTRALK